MMSAMLGDPPQRGELEKLFAEAELLLAHLIFVCAARLAGRCDLLETHEAYLIPGRNSFRIGVRLKAGALHPHHEIILNRWRTGVVARYRRAIGRRSRFSRKLSYLHFRNQRRRHSALIARGAACTASPSHTPSRIAAPP